MDILFSSVGDPPNAIIVNDNTVAESGVNFATFLLHVGPCVVLVGIANFFMLRFLYRKLDQTDEDAEIRVSHGPVQSIETMYISENTLFSKTNFNP